MNVGLEMQLPESILVYCKVNKLFWQIHTLPVQNMIFHAYCKNMFIKHNNYKFIFTIQNT